MTISRERFELALERLKDSDWERFENLASAFLAAEYPNLRTMASNTGDGGRDSELFSPDGEPSIVFQYSVCEKWQPKIRSTIKRINATFPKIKQLHYVSNQEIGPKSDKIRREFAKDGFYIDIIDRSWFLDRANTDQHRSAAASALAKIIVDPILEIKGILSSEITPFSKGEARTALVFLELQQQDRAAGRNLTKSSFEALVRAALQGSSAERRISRKEIHDKIHEFLPQHTENKLIPLIDAALNRLSKGAVKFWKQDDSFHISHEEAERIKDVSAKLFLQVSGFEFEINELIENSAGVQISDVKKFINVIREVIETYFLRRGEEFAAAAAGSASHNTSEPDIRKIITSKLKSKMVSGRDPVGYTYFIINSILNHPGESTLNYLKSMSDSYTLMSFLGETPDVQSITKKLFSHGEIWLDTSVILPIFVESMLSEIDRPFSDIFTRSKKAGAKLYITKGIIEEIERHLNRSLQCARSSNWIGDIPYVLARYTINGGSKIQFSSWLEQFRGDYNPEQDISDYLSDFGINIETPEDSDRIPEHVKNAISSYWQKVQDKRRGGNEGFNMVSDRLARHDVENCLTVLASRFGEAGRSPLGHKCWWLTLDKAAFRMADDLDRDAWSEIRHSPVLSLDFLIQYLSFYPSNQNVLNFDKSASRIFSTALLESIPPELISIAEKVRSDCTGLEERVIQRKIRDALDRAKSDIGSIHQAGLDNFNNAITEIS